MKIWKWFLAVVGGLVFLLTGTALFLDARRELAYQRYRRRKEELDRERAALDEENESDRRRIAELDREIDELKRDLLVRSAATRSERKRFREMSPEEIANETSRLEKLLRDRLGAAVGER